MHGSSYEMTLFARNFGATVQLSGPGIFGIFIAHSYQEA